MKLKRSWVAPLAVALLAIATGGWLLQFGETHEDSPFFKAKLLEEVHRLVSDRYVEETDPGELYQMAIDGMLQELGDPYSVFLDPDDWEQLQLSTTGNYGGLGIRIDRQDDWITVVGILPNSPAEREGLQTGDRIIEVAEESAHGWSTTEAVNELRGPKGSEVQITIARVGLDVPLRFSIERDEIHVISVKSFMLEDGVGFVRLENFSQQARDELKRAIDGLVEQGARRLVLDLQLNPGGLLEEGVAVSDLFLEPGLDVVSTRSRMRGGDETYTTAEDGEYAELPLIVLVDGRSASASEIVAGALQDHDRALVLGVTTFGKGSVQSLFNLAGGNHLKLTTGRWYTPSGRSIQKPHDRDAQINELASQAVSMGGDRVQVSVDTAGRETYRTSSGRVVYGGGGITPDLIVTPDTLASREQAFRSALARNGTAMQVAAFQFGVEWVQDHPNLTEDFEVTADMRDAFFTHLREQVGEAVDRDLYTDAREYVDWWLGREIANAAFGESARLRRTLQRDRQVDEAIALLREAADQQELFALAAERSQEREPQAEATQGDASGSAAGNR